MNFDTNISNAVYNPKTETRTTHSYWKKDLEMQLVNKEIKRLTKSKQEYMTILYVGQKLVGKQRNTYLVRLQAKWKEDQQACR